MHRSRNLFEQNLELKSNITSTKQKWSLDINAHLQRGVESLQPSATGDKAALNLINVGSLTEPWVVP